MQNGRRSRTAEKITFGCARASDSAPINRTVTRWAIKALGMQPLKQETKSPMKAGSILNESALGNKGPQIISPQGKLTNAVEANAPRAVIFAFSLLN